MKKLLPKLSAVLLFAVLFTSCNNEETAIQEEFNLNNARITYADSIIGIDNGNGNFQITADPAKLMADFEEQLASQGDTVSLQTIAIVKKKADNDPADTAHMLIASDNLGTSVGVMLALGANGTFKFDRSFGAAPTTIACRGCATGCNLEYLNMPGGKVPYCNVNGCGEFCSKREISTE